MLIFDARCTFITTKLPLIGLNATALAWTSIGARHECTIYLFYGLRIRMGSVNLWIGIIERLWADCFLLKIKSYLFFKLKRAIWVVVNILWLSLVLHSFLKRHGAIFLLFFVLQNFWQLIVSVFNLYFKRIFTLFYSSGGILYQLSLFFSKKWKKTWASFRWF